MLFKKVLLLCVLSVSINACDSGSSNKDGKKNDYPTYSKTEQVTDLEKLNAVEKSLEKVGLRFEIKRDFKNGLSTKTLRWDKSFLENFVVENGAADNAVVIKKLEEFVAAVNTYVGKYEKPFNSTDDGEESVKVLTDSAKEELNSKANVAKKTVDKLKSK